MLGYLCFPFFVWLTWVIVTRRGWPVMLGVALGIALQWVGHIGLIVASVFFAKLEIYWVSGMLFAGLPILRGVFAMGVAFLLPRTRTAARLHAENQLQTA